MNWNVNSKMSLQTANFGTTYCCFFWKIEHAGRKLGSPVQHLCHQQIVGVVWSVVFNKVKHSIKKEQCVSIPVYLNEMGNRQHPRDHNIGFGVLIIHFTSTYQTALQHCLFSAQITWMLSFKATCRSVPMLRLLPPSRLQTLWSTFHKVTSLKLLTACEHCIPSSHATSPPISEIHVGMIVFRFHKHCTGDLHTMQALSPILNYNIVTSKQQKSWKLYLVYVQTKHPCSATQVISLVYYPMCLQAANSTVFLQYFWLVSQSVQPPPCTTCFWDTERLSPPWGKRTSFGASSFIQQTCPTSN